MTKHQLKAKCVSYDPTQGTVEIETSIPGLEGTTIAMIVGTQYIDDLQFKPIVRLTQAEVAMYLLWVRAEKNPTAMVEQSFTF